MFLVFGLRRVGVREGVGKREGREGGGWMCF